MPLIWQTDAFALATGYDEVVSRYVNLWTPEDKKPAPAPTDSLLKTRFYGVKTLNTEKIAMDFKNIAEEVIAHLRADSTDLTVRIEIEATDASGFDESRMRTVSENARTLKFDQSGFEED